MSNATMECPVCYGAGIYQGNGETCGRCLGWGRVAVKILGPADHSGEVQTEDIDTVYARKDAEEKVRRDLLTFEEWSNEETDKKKAAWRVGRLMSVVAPFYTGSIPL